MKTKKIITALLLILAVSFFSCDNKEVNFPREIDFTLLSCTTWCWLGYVTTDALLIINSNEELKNYFHCLDGSYLLEIDFSKHTLLLVRSRSLLIQEVIVNLTQHSEYKYDLDITIHWRTSIVGHMRFEGLILVPKISDKANIALNLEYIRTN